MQNNIHSMGNIRSIHSIDDNTRIPHTSIPMSKKNDLSLVRPTTHRHHYC